jgi:hypothetical protein
MMVSKNRKINSWLQLIRIPNLFTVPGDILAGHAAVTAFSDFHLGRFLMLCAASALLYCSGLILNDCFDYEEDLRERPKRPLPSGEIEMQEAYAGWLVMTGLALLICWFISPASFKVALIIIGLVIMYNGPARKFPIAAFIIMGLCRGFNILLGASTAWGADGFTIDVSPIFLTETLYILAVTYIAYNETSKLPKHIWCMMPLIVGAGGGVFALIVYGPSIVGISIFLFFLLITSKICYSLDKTLPAKMIPPKIGQLIRNLMLLQAAFAVMASREYIWYAIILIAASPIAARVSRKFYSS